MNFKKYKFIIFLLALCMNYALASDYPKPKYEEEMDEMGSLANGEGLVFRPKKVKSTSTKTTTSNFNEYLHKAAIEILKFTPLSSIDSSQSLHIRPGLNQ